MRTRFDTANRSFFALVGVALVPYLLVAVAGCSLLTIIAVRVASEGVSALSAGPGDLRPALAVFVIVGVGTALALWSLRKQLLATRRLAARVQNLTRPAPPALVEAAQRAGVGGRIDFVDLPEAFSFAYGFWRPRVAVSQGLVDMAEGDELDAVMEHERYHVRNLDPIKVVIARVLSAAYFFLPALRGLRVRYSAASELAADQRAMRACGRSALAGALYRVVRGPSWEELSTAAAIGGPELLHVRVAQLETGQEPPVAPVSRRALLVTAVVLAVLAAAMLVTIVGMGGPAEMMRASMGDRSREMDHDMGTGWYGLWWIVLIPLGVWWYRRRHSSRA